MSYGRVSLISDGKEITILELDGLTVQALSALIYQRSKKEHALFRIQVDVKNRSRLIHVVPELPLVFETDEQFEAVEVDERFKLLRDSVSADGLLRFDADGQPVEPFKKVNRQMKRIY